MVDTIKEKAYIISGYSAFVLVVAVFCLYGAAHGMYIDPSNLP